MNDRSRIEGALQPRRRSWVPLLLLLLVTTFSALAYLEPAQSPPRPPKFPITAKPYLRSAGCLPKRYELGDIISPTCQNLTYLINPDDAFTKGFTYTGRGGGEIYRINKDAVEIHCAAWGTCRVGHVYRNIFQ